MKLLNAKRKPLIIPSDAVAVRAASDEHRLVDLLSLGIYPQISGGAEGFNQAGDIITQTADGRDLNQIWSDFQASLEIYNSERDRLLGMLTFNVTKNPEDVFQGGDTVDFEKASEFGVPRGIRTGALNYYSLGYDFVWYDLATRYTWLYLADATAEQTDALNNQTLEADNRLLFTEVMRAIFNDVTRVAEIQGNNFNVYPFYNGDGTVPPRYKQTIHTAPHTHFLTSGAATVESADLTDMENHLKHHGYGWETGTALLCFANSAQVATIRTFRVADGDPYDFITSQGAPAWAIPTDIMIQPGATPPSVFNGMPVAGRYGPWLIIEDDMIPAAYMLGLASGGENSAQNPVGLREHATPSLRGLRLVKGANPDYPLIDSYYQRGFGTGIRQRGAGVVMQIKVAAGYEIPAAYA